MNGKQRQNLGAEEPPERQNGSVNTRFDCPSTPCKTGGGFTDKVPRVEQESQLPSRKVRGAARRHAEVMMLAVTERREAAADILAEGVVRLLAAANNNIEMMPVLEDDATVHLKAGSVLGHLRLVAKPEAAGSGQ